MGDDVKDIVGLSGDYQRTVQAGPKTTIVDAIASWCEALHGSASLQRALQELSIGLGAEAAMLVRTYPGDSRPSRIAVHDSLTAAQTARPLAQCYADEQFGADIQRPKPGSIWLTSTQAEPGAAALGEFQDSRKLGEFCVLILAASAGVRDHIELHFRNPLTLDTQITLGAVLPTMARTWASRQVGLVTRTVINHRPAVAAVMAAGGAAIPVLSVTNPFRLSRAEFRVCMLLSRGLSVHAVCDQLTLAEATVRSHLRNIYAKTETDSLVELVFLLLERGSAARGGPSAMTA